MSETRVSDQLRRVFAAFDAQDVAALARFMTDDVELRLGNADAIQGKPRDDAAFLGFVAGLVAILEKPSPPSPSPSCDWCSWELATAA
jgi:ketosteroid isomerase-like protein